MILILEHCAGRMGAENANLNKDNLIFIGQYFI